MPEKTKTEVSWDATDDSVMSCDMNGLTITDDVDQPLELHAVSTCAEMSDTMDKIARDLDKSILANKLDVNPHYAVMDVTNLTAEQPPGSASTPVCDRTNPITMSDYDVYDFGDQGKA